MTKLSPRLAEFWIGIQQRVDTAEALKIMAGGRTFRVTENFASFRLDEGKVWGLQVVKPITTLWPDRELSDLYRSVGFQIASYMNQPKGYDVAEPLEKLQSIVYDRLHEWIPPSSMFKRVLVSFRIVRQRPPQGMMDWDEDRQLWMLSSDFTTEAAAK